MTEEIFEGIIELAQEILCRVLNNLNEDQSEHDYRLKYLEINKAVDQLEMIKNNIIENDILNYK